MRKLHAWQMSVAEISLRHGFSLAPVILPDVFCLMQFPSAYGNQEGFHRQSMHRTGHGDYKADRHMASPGFMSRGTGRSRSGGLSSNAPVDDPMQRRTASGEVR